MNDFERKLLDVIAEALMLPQPLPAGFGADSNLFETFGLDSVDALEIVMAVKRAYGVEFSQADERNHEIFTSIRTLASYVTSKQAAQA